MIVAVTPAGVVWSSDKGASWSTTAPIDPKPGSLLEAQSVAVSPSERFLVGTRAGMVHSNDRGASWTPANAGLLGLGIRAIEVAADGTVWAGAGETSMGLGILRTVDQGASWVRSDAAAIAAYIRDIRIDPVTENRPGGPRLFASGSSCVTSNCSQFAAGGSNSGIYVSEDGGLSWSVSGAGLPPSLAGVRIVRTLAIDPHGAASLHSNRLLAGTGAITGNWLVSRSVDAGQNWLPTTGLPNDEPPIESLISQVAFDPHVPGIAYASLVADVPSYAQPTGYQSGVFRSTDFGATWVLASAGLPRLQGWAQFHHGTYSIVVDRWRAGYLWATGAYGPVNDQQSPWAFRSVDGGNRWSACGPGLPAYSSPRRITQSNQNPNVLAIAAAPTEGGTGGVWVSYDGCASWTELGDPSPASATAIVVDGNTVYAGTSQGVQVTTLDADVVLADGFE